MSLGFLPSYSNFPMYHRNDKLLTVRIILIFTSKIRNPPKRVFHPSRLVTPRINNKHSKASILK